MRDAAVKPPSPFKRSARGVGMGIAIGVGAFIGSTLLNSKIAQLVLQLEEPSPLLWLLLEQHFTAPLVVAPALCYLAGRLIEGPRWTIVAAAIVSLQASLALVLAITVHPEVVVSPSELGITVVGGGLGLALSGWAMGRGQRRNPEPAPLAAAHSPTSEAAPVTSADSPAPEPTPTGSDDGKPQP